MANKKYLEILKKNVPYWNDWRQDNPEIVPDLSKAHILGAHILGADLRQADLSKVDLRQADLTGADLREVNLSRADLREADLSGAHLLGADLIQADLRGAHLLGAHLFGAHLRQADLRQADLIQADLREADLRGAHLLGADLREADLRGVNLTQKQINLANGDQYTKLPDGLTHPPHWLEGPPSIPEQFPAPIQVEWTEERLRLTVEHPSAPGEAREDGRAESHNQLCEEIKCQLENLQGKNTARRVVERLEIYAKALGESYQDLNVYRLGHQGIMLRASVLGAEEQLDNIDYHELMGLLASHELLVHQEPKWQTYIKTAQASKITQEENQETFEAAQKITEGLEQFPETIDPKIAEGLKNTREENEDEESKSPEISYGYWQSLGNILIGVVKEAYDHVRTDGKAFVEDRLRELGKESATAARKAIAKSIVDLLLPCFETLAGFVTIFRWLKPVIEFFKKNHPSTKLRLHFAL